MAWNSFRIRKKRLRCKGVGACLIFLATSLPIFVHAGNFDGNDNFNDDAKDAQRWAKDIVDGIGQLTETGGRVHYSASGSPKIGDFSGRPWSATISAAEDWEIRVHVHVPDIPMGPSEHYAMGLIVFKSDSPSDQAVFMLSNESQPNPDGREFYTLLPTPGAGVIYQGEVATTAVDALLRIRWDASASTLASQFSTDQGRVWTSCGPPIQSPWNIEASDAFSVAVAGYSENMTVSLGDNLYADDFWAVAEKPVIDSLHTTGLLTWTDSLTDAYYTIEWAPTVNGPWRRDWSSLTFHQSGSATKQLEVPQFYRVVRE